MMSARSIALAAAALSIGTMSVASAIPPDPRSVSKEYTGPGVIEMDPVGPIGGTFQWGGLPFTARAGETRIDVTIADAFVDGVGGYVRQDASKHGPEVFHAFCGSTRAPVSITPKRDVWIYPSTTPCGQSPGTAIKGEITATFYGK
jgi:hypothetical protein